MKFLAFITFLVTEPHSGDQTSFTTTAPTDCIAIGESITVEMEADGFLVDYFCDYTRAPATSMRPKARPMGVDT
jgi:hypothetical protein